MNFATLHSQDPVYYTFTHSANYDDSTECSIGCGIPLDTIQLLSAFIYLKAEQILEQRFGIDCLPIGEEMIVQTLLSLGCTYFDKQQCDEAIRSGKSHFRVDVFECREKYVCNSHGFPQCEFETLDALFGPQVVEAFDILLKLPLSSLYQELDWFDREYPGQRIGERPHV